MKMAQKTPISMLQELMVSIRAPLPIYTINSVGNVVKPAFSCRVQAGSVDVTVEARNKKEAKQLAAQFALEKLGYKVSYGIENSSNISEVSNNNKLPFVSSEANFLGKKDYISELHEFASGSGFSYPVYEIPMFAVNGQFECICKFQDAETTGYSNNKKQAKQIASYQMLVLFKSGKINIATSQYHKQKSIKANRTESLMDFNEKDKEVLKRLEALSITSSNVQLGLPHSEAFPNIQKGGLSREKAEDELKKYNLRYEIKELQNNPYVVEVNVNDKKITLLGGGLTKDEATTRALNSTLEILREGCSLIN